MWYIKHYATSMIILMQIGLYGSHKAVVFSQKDYL